MNELFLSMQPWVDRLPLAPDLLELTLLRFDTQWGVYENGYRLVISNTDQILVDIVLR